MSTVSNDQILEAVNKLATQVSEINTRLFGRADGADGEGRLIIVERRINNHATRIADLETTKISLSGKVSGAMAVCVFIGAIAKYAIDFVVKIYRGH
jgi:hypothetical protein